MLNTSEILWDQFLDPYNKIPIPIAIWIRFSDEIILVDANQYAVDVTDGIIKDKCGCFASEMYKNHMTLVNCLKSCLDKKRQISEEIEIKSSNSDKFAKIRIKFHFCSPNIVYMFFYNKVPEWVWNEFSLVGNKDNSKSLKFNQIQKLKRAIIEGKTSKDIGLIYRDLFIHDMNNIFSNIQSSTHLCSYFLKEKSSYEKVGEFCDLILDQVNRGKKVISNVFTYLELEKESKTLEKIDLLEYLTTSIEYIHKTYLTREIKIALKTENDTCYVLANNLIGALFDNVLTNAIKYNDQEVVKIIIRVSRKIQNDRYYIKVEFLDNGIGIPDKKKKNIFKVKSQKDQAHTGMGIGLSLVKRIVTILNGEIWVENRIQKDYTKGSNFVILIPEYVQDK
jgi:nitrogen-specific signal transduction histidine kinase